MLYDVRYTNLQEQQSNAIEVEHIASFSSDSYSQVIHDMANKDSTDKQQVKMESRMTTLSFTDHRSIKQRLCKIGWRMRWHLLSACSTAARRASGDMTMQDIPSHKQKCLLKFLV